MGRPKFVSLGLLFAVVAGALIRAPNAFAADPDTEARERYERALKLYEERAFDAALVELKAAAELRPSYKLLYNIAQVRLAMNDYAAALDAYRRYLDGGGDKIPAARRDAVTREMKRLESRVAKITVETDVPGAEVFVDDVSYGNTPLDAPVLVNSGFRQVVVRHPDYVPQGRRLSLAGGMQEKVRFVLVNQAPLGTSEAAATEPVNAASLPPPTGDAPAFSGVTSIDPDASSASSTGSGSNVPWLAWGVTGALAVGAGVVGGLALAENSSLRDDRNTEGASASELDSKASRVRTLAIVTDTLAAGAIIAGGVSLWLTLDRSSRKSEQSRGAELRVGLHANQLTFAGTF